VEHTDAVQRTSGDIDVQYVIVPPATLAGERIKFLFGELPKGHVKKHTAAVDELEYDSESKVSTYIK
jgi:hypothetical protein